tara:strand:+ start:802 stop:1218 length:417 start_codon:yes stop_codon:yes gene_type:complete
MLESQQKRKVRKPASIKARDKKKTKRAANTSGVRRIQGDGIAQKRKSTEYPMPKFGKMTSNEKLKNDRLIRSVSGDVVGTEKAFQKADRVVPDYDYDTMDDSIDSWMKEGGSIKKKMKKTKVKKRVSLRGQGKALRGF